MRFVSQSVSGVNLYDIFVLLTLTLACLRAKLRPNMFTLISNPRRPRRKKLSSPWEGRALLLG